MHEFRMHYFLIKKQNIKLIAIILKAARKEENNSRFLEALYYYSQLWWLYKNEIITWDLCFNIVEFENLRGDSEWAGDSIRISSKFLRLGNSGVVAMWKRSTIFSEAIQVSWRRAKREREGGGGRKTDKETRTSTFYFPYKFSDVKGGKRRAQETHAVCTKKTRPGLNNITMPKLHFVSISLTSSELPHGQVPNRFLAPLSRKQFNSYLAVLLQRLEVILKAFSTTATDVSSFVQTNRCRL